MLRIFLIRPGSTDFDQQRRIKGTLDIPLNDIGKQQAVQSAEALSNTDIEIVYSAPCQSAWQTAEMLADRLDVKLKRLDTLHNLDHGLWHGMLIEDVKQRQPKVYRMWQEQPETVCPPEGETVAAARLRVQRAEATVAQAQARSDWDRGSRTTGQHPAVLLAALRLGRPVEVGVRLRRLGNYRHRLTDRCGSQGGRGLDHV